MKANLLAIATMRDWIEAGNRGSCDDIATVFKLSKDQAYYRLKKLRDEGVAVVVSVIPGGPKPTGGFTPDTAIWGRADDKRPNVDIARSAIETMPDLLKVWMKPARRQQEARA